MVDKAILIFNTEMNTHQAAYTCTQQIKFFKVLKNSNLLVATDTGVELVVRKGEDGDKYFKKGAISNMNSIISMRLTRAEDILIVCESGYKDCKVSKIILKQD